MGMKSTREKVMMVVLGFVVLAAAWYLLFLTPTNDAIADMQVQENNIAEENTSITNQISVFKRWQEQLGLDMNSDDDSFTKIADYNNIVGLTNDLNTILAPASSFNMTFNDPYPVAEKDAIRRDIQLSFVANDYMTAYSIISNLNSMQNGCFITDMSISGGAGDASVGLRISIFEYKKTTPSPSSDSEETLE